MKTILFSKALKDRSVGELVELAQSLGIDGYDLCVRPGYAVNPDNAAAQLPEAAALFRRNGLDIPMVTGNFDVLRRPWRWSAAIQASRRSSRPCFQTGGTAVSSASAGGSKV